MLNLYKYARVRQCHLSYDKELIFAVILHTNAVCENVLIVVCNRSSQCRIFFLTKMKKKIPILRLVFKSNDFMVERMANLGTELPFVDNFRIYTCV